MNNSQYLFLFLIISCTHTKNFDLNSDLFSSKSSESYLHSSGEDIYISWTEQKLDSNYLYNSRFNGNSWGKKELITKGKDWFINWADFPSISHNKISNTFFSFNLQKSSEETFSYDIKYFFKKGEWVDMKNIHTDNTFTEHGFVSVVPYGEGFIVSWLDGRNTLPSSDGHGKGAMTLRSAEIDKEGKIINERLVDSMVCECCQTSMTIAGKIPLLVYRDRSREETRDIYVSRYINSQWSEPFPIHDDGWTINGCPVNGPNIDSFDDKVVVSWFSASNGIPKVNLKFSNNKGQSFGRKILVDNIDNKPMGRVDVEFINKDEILVSWLSIVDGEGKLLMRKVNSMGTLGDINIIKEVSTERSTGFPQIEKWEDNIFLSWTDISGREKRVKTSKIPLSSL